MNLFVDAVASKERTENGMATFKSSTSALIDFFYKAGAMRGRDIIPDFDSAFKAHPALALRLALWLRDARGGAGERKLFRDILQHLEVHQPEMALAILPVVPEVGRWDDLLVFRSATLQHAAYGMILEAISQGNRLAAKWSPRKGLIADRIRKQGGMSPKQYRQFLVQRTDVVENKMCARKFTEIEFGTVPSIAASRYSSAFNRNAPAEYAAYKSKLVTGESKINASAIYPYQVIQNLRMGDDEIAEAQWKALPNYMTDAKILPMVDVSGSMMVPSGNPSVTCLDVALSLGLYCADKNTGDFNGMFLTFSNQPELLKLTGDLLHRMEQMESSRWGMNTNLHAAIDLVLRTAVKNNVPPEDMPDTLLVLSDMQFDECARWDDTAMEMIARKYQDSLFGNENYKIPKIVFWNLRASTGVPAKDTANGVALVSGMSPSILEAILANKEITPESVMMEAIMKSKYDFVMP